MSIENKVPGIRFKGFSGGISTKNLKEIVITNTYGPRFNANDYDKNGNVKTIRGTDISIDGRVLYNQVPLASLDVNFIKEHILEDGDLVMITTADCGLTGLFEKQTDKYICSAYAVKVTLDQELASPLYFKYFFQTTLAKTEINKFIRKATVANLPASAILQIAHKIPCKPEQTAIGNTFQKLDSLINQHQQKHDKLSNIKKAMLEKMFPKQGENIPEIRFKGFSGEWVVRSWRDTVDISTNMVDPRSSQYGELFHVGPGNIESFTGMFYNNVLKVKDSNLISGKFHFNKGDIIYGKINPQLAKYVIAPFEGLASADAYVLSAKNGVVQNYLYAILQTEDFYKYTVSVSSRTGMPKINRDELNIYSYLSPDEAEQQRIGNYFQKLDALIKQHQQQITKLNNIKQACLSKMFV